MKLIHLLTLLISINAYSQNIQTEISKPMLQYLIRQPKIKSEHPPAIILLHGIGSNEKDLFSFADKLPDKFLVVSARAPNLIGDSSYAWYQVDYSTGTPVINFQQEQESRNKIIAFIEQVKSEYHCDGKNIYLCGFSQGAIMAFSIGLTRPDLLKGIGVMSGRLLDEIKPVIDKTEQLKKLKIFISHGTSDYVLNIEYARYALQYLKLIGLNPTYKEFDIGHGINDSVLNDLIKWLSD
jgi:phospholipase/carboxylesterase